MFLYIVTSLKTEFVLLDEASGYGRNFARSGGVAEAVVQTLKEKAIDFEAKAVPCSGTAACEMALMKLKVGRLEGNFIEGMACEGGCVQGAGCLVRSPKNKMDVEKHAKEAKDRGVVEAVNAAKGIEPAAAAATADGKAEKV